MPEIIQINYEQMDEASRRFNSLEETAHQVQEQLSQSVSSLSGRGWMGESATAFFKQWETEILPAIQALGRALKNSGAAASKIAGVFRQAEEEAQSRTGKEQTDTAATLSPTTTDSVSPHPARRQPDDSDKHDIFHQIEEAIKHPHEALSILHGIDAFEKARWPERYAKIVEELLPWSVPESWMHMPSVSEAQARRFEEIFGRKSLVEKIVHNKAVKWGGLGIGMIDVALNTVKLIDDANDGNGLNVDSMENISDLVGGSASIMAELPIIGGTSAGLVAGAFAGGYYGGKLLDWGTEKVTGLVSKALGGSGKGMGISDIPAAFIPDQPDWPVRNWIDDFVQLNGAPDDKAAYFHWRKEWKASGAEYQLPNIPILRNIPPHIVQRAQMDRKMSQEDIDLLQKVFRKK